MRDRTDELRALQRRSNLLLGAYALCLIGLVSLAPKEYSAVVPAARAFALMSDHAAAAGFAIDMMWALFPVFLVALAWRTTPTRFNSRGQALACFLLLGLAIAPLLLYFGTINTSFDLGDSLKLGRALVSSAQSQVWFLVYWGFYFLGTLGAVWAGCIEAPRWLVHSDRNI